MPGTPRPCVKRPGASAKDPFKRSARDSGLLPLCLGNLREADGYRARRFAEQGRGLGPVPAQPLSHADE